MAAIKTRGLVLQDHNDSNYKGVMENIQSQFGIPAAQVYPVDTKLDPQAAAQAYEATLRGLFPSSDSTPTLDAVILGAGGDGHTASLFPGHPSLQAPTGSLILAETSSPKPPKERVTMSLDLINHARHVAFAIVGAGKRDMVQRSLVKCAEASAPASTVAGNVSVTGDRVHWILGADAAPPCAQTCHEESSRNGMNSFVWFGSRGALAKKYTWTVMFDLYQKGQLDGTNIHAVGSDKVERGSVFVTDMIGQKGKCLPTSGHSDINCASFKQRFGHDHFTYAMVTRTKDPRELSAQYAKLNQNIGAKMHSEGDKETRIYYLSVPDSAHVKTVQMIKKECMPASGGIARFVIEKPFGADLKDVHRRQKALEEQGLRPGDIWRLDHYLGKRGVRNILDFRLQNPHWEAKWNSKHIASVELVVQENENVADRIDFYAETGVVRDMMVNHIMEILGTVAMNLPDDPTDLAQFPQERAILLESIAPLTRKDIVLGQYAEYSDHYREHFEANPTARKVDKGEDAPTLGYAKLTIPTKRWTGVHFGIVHAKGIDTRKAYVRVNFKDGGWLLLHIQGGEGNEFISIFPSDNKAKMKGWRNKTKRRDNAEGSDEESVLIPATNSLQAYEVLLGDAFKGDQSYFVTFREVVAGYKAWDAVMGFVPVVSKYPLGTSLGEAVQAAVASSLGFVALPKTTGGVTPLTVESCITSCRGATLTEP